jgi:transcriptional regulator GlxA family with amidase domain
VPSIEEHEPAGDAQTAGARNASDDEFLTTLRQIVNSRMGNEEIDAAHLAPLMSMSQTQLRRKIAATSGISAARYVLSLRIERAKELLAQHPHMSIIDVAYSTGFSDNQHFTRVFHRMVGVTPMQYARSHSN